MKQHYHKAKKALEKFRDKQISFSKKAHDRAIKREKQKLELQKIKTEIGINRGRVKHANAKVHRIKTRHRLPKVRLNYKHASKMIRG